MRLRRGHAWVPLATLLVSGGVSFLAAAVLLLEDEPAAPATAEQRVTTVRQAASAPDAAPLVALLDGAPDPKTRAMTITALARHPDDAAARAALVGALGADRPRAERLLALSVLSSLPRRGWAASAIAPLSSDPDPDVRARVRKLLAEAP
jgi:muconolactone delta-isomerase